MGSYWFELKDQANLEMLTLDIIKTSEIEGELIDPDKVRSSIARRLGLEIPGLVASDRSVDGLVDMMLDATRNYNKELNKDRSILMAQLTVSYRIQWYEQNNH